MAGGLLSNTSGALRAGASTRVSPGRTATTKSKAIDEVVSPNSKKTKVTAIGGKK